MSALARAANALLGRAGLRLNGPGGPMRASLEGSLAQARDAGFRPSAVVDVGAAYGDWSRACAGVFPEARYVLVEPLDEYEPFLAATARALSGATIVRAVAATAPGTATINVHPDLVGSSTRAEPGLTAEPRTVAATTVDELVREHGFHPPFLLKIDAQGAELDVLAGAERTLPDCGLVVLEALLHPFYDDAPVLADLVAHLGDRGFALHDAFGLGYRPLDGALAQVDLVFARADGVLRRDHRYATPAQRERQDAAMRAAHAARRSNG